MISKPALLLRPEIVAPEFFSTPAKKMTVEEGRPGTGRTYVLKGDRIVAVALASEEA